MDWLLEQWNWLTRQETLVAWAGGLSVLTLIVSFLVVPIVIRRMPHDYFLENDVQAEALREEHPLLRILFLLLKNLLGAILVIGGLIMFVTPGQGVLTLLIGLLMMNFPGKRRLEIRLIRIKPVHRAIDWIRKRGGKEPLQLPD
jgi:hypothetical protein